MPTKTTKKKVTKKKAVTKKAPVKKKVTAKKKAPVKKADAKTAEKVAAAATAPKKKKKKYLNNKDLLAEVILSKEQGQMTDKLARMLTMLTNNYGKRDNYANYTYIDDMKAYAMMMIVRTWFKFDENKSNNPFAFYTQCIKHSFIQYLNQEKRHRVLRDEILVKKGLTPSFNYQLEYENRKLADDEEDHHQQVETAEKLNEEQNSSSDEDFITY